MCSLKTDRQYVVTYYGCGLGRLGGSGHGTEVAVAPATDPVTIVVAFELPISGGDTQALEKIIFRTGIA
jgi:hypothetical protein